MTSMGQSASVAVIGAGPGGLAAGRFLRDAGLGVTLFDQADGVGGQWLAGSPFSSIWRGMHTNTSRVMTAFGDMPHADATPAYPAAEEIGAYLERYAAHHGLLAAARFGTRVEDIERHASSARWVVRSRDASGIVREEPFSHVVVATGRHHRPAQPDVEGMDGFTGRGGVRHARTYRGAAPHRGERVLVAGCSISSLEVASELAMDGATRVVVSARRHRYILQRMLGGVPMDHRVYTRGAGLAWEHLPPHELSAWLKSLVLRTSGDPRHFGAPVHDDDILVAGFSHSPFYLQLVAEGRIAPRPWIARVSGNTVHFTDGRSEAFDTILCCTGYALDLPFLGRSVREALQPDTRFIDLHHHTFHPDLPGLAFMGMYEHAGPFFQRWSSRRGGWPTSGAGGAPFRPEKRWRMAWRPPVPHARARTSSA